MDSDPQPHNNRQFFTKNGNFRGCWTAANYNLANVPYLLILGAYSVFLWIFCAYSVFYNRVRLGLATEFRSEKTAEYTQNGFRYSTEESAHYEAFRGLRKSQFWSSERNGITWKNSVLQKSCSSKHNWELVFVREILLNGILRVCFSTSIFAPRNGIPSCFFFHGMVRNRIPSVCFYFCSMERNSELFSLLWNGSEWNSDSLLLFLFHGTEFRAFLSSAERFGTEVREFSVPRNSRNSAGTNQCSLYSVFRWIIFLSEIANPSAGPHGPSPLFREGTLHRKKKVREFPVPSRDVTTKLSLGGNNDVIAELFLPRGSLVRDIPAGDGKLMNLFYGVGLFHAHKFSTLSTYIGGVQIPGALSLV